MITVGQVVTMGKNKFTKSDYWGKSGKVVEVVSPDYIVVDFGRGFNTIVLQEELER